MVVLPELSLCVIQEAYLGKVCELDACFPEMKIQSGFSIYSFIDLSQVMNHTQLW